MRTLRPCAHFGCAALVSRGMYCDNHQKPRLDRHDERRESSHKRGYDRLWGRCRKAYLSSNPLCVECGEPATQVHHVVSIASGGDRLDPENLMALCAGCHSRITNRESRK